MMDNVLISDDAIVDSPVMLEMSPDGVAHMSMDEYNDGGCSQGRMFCCKRRKNLLVFVCGGLALLAGLGALAFVLYDHPAFYDASGHGSADSESDKKQEEAAILLRQRNDAYYLQLREALVTEIYNGSYDPYIFLKPNSAQKLAMQWMSYKDTLHLALPVTSATANISAQVETITAVESTPNRRWIQRFVLMTLFYENAGESWFFGTGGNNVTSASGSTAEAGANNATRSIWSKLGGVHECQWDLIECDDQDHVVSIDLGGTSIIMTGTLPNEIGLLAELRHLVLSQNRLKGSLPSAFYDLTNLETLDLSINGLSGKIDNRIGGFQNLSTLFLSQNAFSGTLPTSLHKLTKLKVFEMGLNPLLGGSVLDVMIHWPNLETMDISETNVTGTIPTEFGMLSSLRDAGMWAVPLSGTIPTEVGNLRAMEYLVMGKKNLMGSLPSEIGLWTNMQYASIMEAMLSGSIPSEIGAWTNCHTFMYKGCTNVRGTLPTELGLMTDLETFEVFDTKLSGVIPSELGLLTNAFDLFFHLTEFTGTMPKEICDLTSLKDLTSDCWPVSPGVPPQIECECCTDCFNY